MKGLLLVNTGSPKSPSHRDVRGFIEAMLSDPLVMTIPTFFRIVLVKGIIGPFRQFASAKKYKLIWDETQNQSPLLCHTQKLALAIEDQMDIRVEVGMRYLEPNISDALANLDARDEDLKEVVALPLFPHYAESSYLTAIKEIQRSYDSGKYSFNLRVIEPYFNHPAYIKALSKSIEPYLDDRFERILFNFHSLPLECVEEGFDKGKDFDYVYQVKETIRLLIHELNLSPKKVRIVYSSAFGKKWLEPSLDESVQKLGESGVKNILVVSPGFAADNLETLYDIGVKAKAEFQSHGGREFVYVPCLNHEQYWVDAIRQIIL